MGEQDAVTLDQFLGEERPKDGVSFNVSLKALTHEVASSIPIDQQLARLERVTQNGTVTDIEFTQDNHKIRLKELFPGDYSIVFTHYSQQEIDEDPDKAGGFDPITGVLTMNEMPGMPNNDRYYILFHEGGHTTDKDVHKSLYEETWRILSSLDIQRKILSAQLLAMMDGKNQQDIDISNIIADLPQNSQLDREELHKFMESTESVDPQKELMERCLNLDLAYEQLFARLKANEERNANIYALEAMKIAAKRGVCIYNGSSDQLQKIIYNGLISYQQSADGKLRGRTRIDFLDDDQVSAESRGITFHPPDGFFYLVKPIATSPLEQDHSEKIGEIRAELHKNNGVVQSET